MAAVYKRELRALFCSPLAYVLLGIFAFYSGIIFVQSNLLTGYANINQTFTNLSVSLLFIIPLLTMKSLAEDRKTGVDKLLISSATSVQEIVIGKFLACYTIFLSMMVYTLIFPVILSQYGSPDTAMVVGTYIGYILLGGAFISIGILSSAMTSSQIIAAVVSFVASIMMLVFQGISGSVGGLTAVLLNWISLLSRFDGFNSGVFDLSAVLYYVSFTAVMLILAVQVIEKRRWTQS